MSSSPIRTPPVRPLPSRPTRLHRLLAVLVPLLFVGLAPAAAAAQSPCGGFHTVRTGDSLLEIAERCGVTLPALVAANPGVVDQRDITEGDRLRIPSPTARQPTPVEACGAVYVVRTGDTLAEIAEKCGLTIPLLVAANPPLPDQLGVQEGLRIRIPNVASGAIRDPAIIVADPAAADTVVVEGEDAEPDPPELARVEGVLEAGERCLRVRDADGDTTAIVGEVRSGFAPGDRVVLLGLPVEDHDCGVSPALELRILYRAGT